VGVYHIDFVDEHVGIISEHVDVVVVKGLVRLGLNVWLNVVTLK